MLRNYRYRLLPTKSQVKRLEQVLFLTWWIYNECIAASKRSYQEQKKRLNKGELCKLIIALRTQKPDLAKFNSHMIREPADRISKAYEAAFGRLKRAKKPGFPKFRKRKFHNSFTFPSEGAGGTSPFRITDDGKLRMSKIGDLRIILHRQLPADLRGLTVKRNPLGNWYATIGADIGPKYGTVVSEVEAVGIDVGLSWFVTLSTGEQIPNPRFFDHDAHALAKAQRRLSAAKKGSLEYRRINRVINHIHERVRNRRDDFTHQLSHRLAAEHEIIACEALKIQDMVDKKKKKDYSFRGIRRGIHDAAWRQFLSRLEYKMTALGRTLAFVDPAYTSQECSGCGKMVPKELSMRVHLCPDCGLHLDRDVNAAKVIAKRAMKSIMDRAS